MGHNGSPEEIWGGAHKCLYRWPKAILLRVNLYPPTTVTGLRPNRDSESRYHEGRTIIVAGMHSHLGLDDFPDDVSREFPAPVRRALSNRARAGAALRLYRRRGWNDSAVRFQYNRATAELEQALEDWEHAEMNPALF